MVVGNALQPVEHAEAQKEEYLAPNLTHATVRRTSQVRRLPEIQQSVAQAPQCSWRPGKRRCPVTAWLFGMVHVACKLYL